jgi:hypothetical protein
MTETTQDGADVVERLRALARHEHSDLSIGHEAADIIDVHRKTIEIANAGWNKDHSELTRLRTENEALREALTLAEAVLSNAPEFETTAGGRIPLTKVSEARDVARAALKEPSNG